MFVPLQFLSLVLVPIGLHLFPSLVLIPTGLQPFPSQVFFPLAFGRSQAGPRSHQLNGNFVFLLRVQSCPSFVPKASLPSHQLLAGPGERQLDDSTFYIFPLRKHFDVLFGWTVEKLCAQHLKFVMLFIYCRIKYLAEAVAKDILMKDIPESHAQLTQACQPSKHAKTMDLIGLRQICYLTMRIMCTPLFEQLRKKLMSRL